MNSHHIVVNFIWTFDELVEGDRWNYRHRVRRIFRVAIVGLAILFLLVGAISIWDDPSVGIIAIAAGLLILMCRPVIVPWLLRRQYKSRPDNDCAIEWRFTTDGIEYQTDLGSGEASWKSFVKVVQSPSGYLFYPTQQIYHWLPRHGFSCNEDFDRLAELAQQHGRQFQLVG